MMSARTTNDKEDNAMLIQTDENLDTILIEFEAGTAGYAEELDDDRVVDYSLNPGHPIGVCLHHVSAGVRIEGLPQPEKVKKILESLDIPIQ